MKKTLLLSLTVLAFLANTHEANASRKDRKQRQVQIAEMAKDKETRAMMIRQLMSTSEGKKEMSEMLRHDAEFRSYYETHSVDPG